MSAVRRVLDGVKGVDRFVAGRKEFFRIAHFLDASECTRLLEVARHGKLLDGAEALLADIDARVCNLMGLSGSSGMPLNFSPARQIDLPDPDEWTFAIYLQDSDAKGPLRLAPGSQLPIHRGMALICKGPAPMCRDEFLTKTLHMREAALPPAYTHTGFQRLPIPPAVFGLLRDFYDQASTQAVAEFVPGYIESDRPVASELLQLPSVLQHGVHLALHDLMEQWSGTALMPTHVYGVRRYARGARLKVHRDRSGTHVFGATLNIAEKLEAPWPLVIDDHLARRHEITLQPGEMLLYESERLLHGRPRPLQGELYAGVFAHYRPRRGAEAFTGSRPH